MINTRTNRLLVSFVLTAILMAVLVLLGSAGRRSTGSVAVDDSVAASDNVCRTEVKEPSKPPRMVIMLGGSMPEGLIQGVTYFLFFWGLFEVIAIRKKLKYEEQAFDHHFLVEDKEWLYNADDAYQLKQKLEEKNKHHHFQLVELAVLVCMKYRISKSSSEALSVLESETANMNAEVESDQAFLRYIAWAIPSVGFIGTVLGIASSLGYANQASTPEGIERVTSALAVAFDTTLVALFLSIILMLAIHALQKRQDDLYTRMRTYILHNLINRLYK